MITIEIKGRIEKGNVESKHRFKNKIDIQKCGTKM